MKIVVSFDNEIEEKEINNIDELKDELLEFAGYFIPADSEYAVGLLENNRFDELIDEIEDYYVNSYFKLAKEFFLTLKKINSYNSMDEIVNEFEVLNKVFSDAGLNIKYSSK